MSDLKDKKIGTLVGLAVGDAMGAPYEFQYRSHYKATLEYNTGGSHNIRIGEWTDDTSMALCLAQSIIDTKDFNPIDQMNNYLKWYREGYMCTRKRCFDIGTATRNSIYAFEQSDKNIPYTLTGSEETNGNGTIMRLAPIVMKYSRDKDLLEYAKKSSLTTHRGIDAYNSAMTMASIIDNCYKYSDKMQIISTAKDLTGHDIIKTIIEDIGEKHYDPNYKIPTTIPTGYCIDTLECALKGFMLHDTFIDGLMYCISLGDDTDTVGAVYGQIAGAYYGLSGIPQYYKDNLMMYNLIYDTAVKLIED